MDDRRITLSRRAAQAGLIVAAAALLWGGATWRGLAANEPAPPSWSQRSSTASQPAIARATATGRDSYADIVGVISPAVVTIRTEGKAKTSPTTFQGDDFFRRFFGDQFDSGPRFPRSFRQRGLGSGVVMSSDGYILTNHHVVDGAEDIRVDLTDGRTLAARVVGFDKPSDLALLKVSESNLHAVILGNSDVVQVGDVVLAVGNPLGVGQTVTLGIVSAKGRHTDVGNGSYEDFLQTDAPINQGNSGGALVNTKGELVGINSQILSMSEGNIGIGFAIPVNMATHVADELRKEGRVHRAQLGVSVQPVTSDMAANLGLKDIAGAIISAVEPDSAAARAGLKQGDVIQTFNGESVKDTNGLRNRVADMPPGSSATVGIVRDGTPRDVTVKLDEVSVPQSARRAAEPGSDNQSALGVSVSPLTTELATRLRMPRNARGLVVEEVNPDSRAAEAGIQPGDIIQEMNRRPVQSVEELRAAVHGGGDRPLLLLINREGRDLFLTVRSAR